MWQAPYDPVSATAAVDRSFSRWQFRVKNSGSSLRVYPRSRGGPLYVIEVDANRADGGSQIQTCVRPKSRGLARTAIVSAVTAALSLIFIGTDVQFGLPFMWGPSAGGGGTASLLIVSCLVTFISSLQLVLMGKVRKGGSKRLKRAMLTAGATELSAPGWYPDPWRRAALRWWAGTAWTSNTHV